MEKDVLMLILGGILAAGGGVLTVLLSDWLQTRRETRRWKKEYREKELAKLKAILDSLAIHIAHVAGEMVLPRVSTTASSTQHWLLITQRAMKKTPAGEALESLPPLLFSFRGDRFVNLIDQILDLLGPLGEPHSQEERQRYSQAADLLHQAYERVEELSTEV